MVGKRNSFSGSIVLTAHLLLCCMGWDSRPHTWAIDETLETQILKDITDHYPF